MFDKSKAKDRLKELREGKKWSQRELADKLNSLLGQDSNAKRKMSLEENSGKETVSQLERGARGITLDIAFAYSEIFDVSLDFVLGKSDDWQPQNKNIKKVTGLSDNALKELYTIKNGKNAELKLFVLNILFENKYIESFINFVISDACFSVIRNRLNKANAGSNNAFTDTITDQAEFSLWKFSKMVSDSLISVSKEISKSRLIVKEIGHILKNLSDSRKNKANKEIQIINKLIDQIYGVENI